MIDPTIEVLREWRLVPGHPNYEVSDAGEVRRATEGKSTAAGRVLRQKAHNGKYRRVTFSSHGIQTYHFVHHLVLGAFVGDRPTTKYECNHIDSDPSNNSLQNLEWVTPSENTIHSYRFGAKQPTRGETAPRSKLAAAQVVEIRARYAAGKRRSELAREYGISWNSLNDIVQRKSWTHI